MEFAIDTTTTKWLTDVTVHSQQYSDNLYHFDKKPDRIASALTRGGLTLNNVVEDLSFLGVEQICHVAFPMICFCDIVPEKHRLKPHMDQYGSYGIGLSKNWGREQGVQPVHYILPTSPYARDFSQAINAAFSATDSLDTEPTKTLCDFLVTNLAFAKPLWGSNNGTNYCFEDECEWRFIPSDLAIDMPRFLPEPKDEKLDNFRQTLWMPSTYLLSFSYGDISDIFVPEGEVSSLHKVIDELDATKEEKQVLKTKVREI